MRTTKINKRLQCIEQMRYVKVLLNNLVKMQQNQQKKSFYTLRVISDYFVNLYGLRMIKMTKKNFLKAR